MQHLIPHLQVDPSAKIGSGCLIGPDVSIGAGCKIGNGVRLSHCVIMRGVSIKDHSKVSRAGRQACGRCLEK
jgi:mannose-1-phosphate guanylyltransferase